MRSGWLAECSIATPLIVLVVLLGLLIVPTSCTCGAAIAHPHSLFLIPYHHHSDDGEQFDSDTGQHDGQEPTQVSFDLGDAGPTIHQASLGSTTSQQFADVMAHLFTLAALGPLARPAPRIFIPVDHVVVPDPPPPR
jgi:hypothetical protein